jgi:hypothetical protein
MVLGNFGVATSLKGSTTFLFSIPLPKEVNENVVIAIIEKSNFFIIINLFGYVFHY